MALIEILLCGSGRLMVKSWEQIAKMQYLLFVAFASHQRSSYAWIAWIDIDKGLVIPNLFEKNGERVLKRSKSPYTVPYSVHHFCFGIISVDS